MCDASTAGILSALALQVEWGAEDALADAPLDRRGTQERVGQGQDEISPHAVKDRRAPKRAGPVMIAAHDHDLDSIRDLAALRGALEAFDQCALKRTATQLVFADGSETARIMLIGEAPGAEEDRSGVPFVGPAGQLLDRMMASIGLDRTSVRIVNTVPWRPPGNRAPSEAEIAQCLPFLYKHIALIRPDFLVLLGGVALRALIGGREGITRMRGRWQELEIPGVPAPLSTLPTYHPAFLLRQPSAKRQTWVDLLSLLARSRDQISTRN